MGGPKQRGKDLKLVLGRLWQATSLFFPKKSGDVTTACQEPNVAARVEAGVAARVWTGFVAREEVGAASLEEAGAETRDEAGVVAGKVLWQTTFLHLSYLCGVRPMS